MIFFFFFNDTATTEIYTLSLHDALPISSRSPIRKLKEAATALGLELVLSKDRILERSEEHTSELQSLAYLVCRLLLEKKKKTQRQTKLQNQHLARREHWASSQSDTHAAN